MSLPSSRHPLYQLSRYDFPDEVPVRPGEKAFRKFQVCFLSYYGPNQPPPDMLELTREEEQAAFLRYAKRKTAKTREILVRRYLCWAFRLAAKYKGPRLDFDEAVGVANLGLMEALRDFDPKRGYRFTTYAFFVVRRKLIEAIISTYPVRVSDHLRKSLRALQIPAEEQAKELSWGDEPRTLEEFFDRLGETTTFDVSSLHERQEDAPFSPAPSEDPVAVLEHADLSDSLRRALESLEPLEREVILARHYREPAESFASIGARLRISKNRARDAGDEALVKLRRFLKQEQES